MGEISQCLHYIFKLLETVFQDVLYHFHNFFRFGHNQRVQWRDRIRHGQYNRLMNDESNSMDVPFQSTPGELLVILCIRLRESECHGY